MAASFDPVVSPSIAAQVIKVYTSTGGKVAKVKAEADAARVRAVNIMLDAMRVACNVPHALFLKGNAATNAAKAQVSDMFKAIAETGEISKGSIGAYGTGFWYAFEKGIPWTPDLHNQKVKPNGDTTGDDGASKPTSGPVEKTDVPALHKTLSKAIAQARLLNQSTFVADLTDLIIETWPDFKESSK